MLKISAKRMPRGGLILSLRCMLVLAAVSDDPLGGQTPCCEDRLTTIVCNRQKLQNAASFLHKCIKNPDFALVQCCRTWSVRQCSTHSKLTCCYNTPLSFDQSEDDTYKLDYAKTIEFLLTDPLTAQCSDRRSREWCELFARNRLGPAQLPTMPNYEGGKGMDCSNVPVAFRLCRKSCGYCSTGGRTSNAVYDYPTARDPIKCYNPSKGLAQRRMNMKEVYRDFANRFTDRFTNASPSAKDVRGRREQKFSKHRRKHATTTSTTTTPPSTSTRGNEIEDSWGFEERVEFYSPNDYFVVMDNDYDWS